MVNILKYMLIGYAFGIIPVAYIICKINGVDIYHEGSGNPGSTNVARILGKKWGTIAFILDIVKTLIPICITLLIFYKTNNDMYNRANIILYTGLGSVIGHIFPITMKFKGGKGVACTFAVILFFSPIYGLSLFIFQKIIAKTTHIVSLASILALLLMIISALVLSIFQIYPFNFINSIDMCIPIGLMSLICIIMHKDNIKRLLTNTENKV